MKRSSIVKLAVLGTILFSGVEAVLAEVSYSFTTINVPGTVQTVPEGINNGGQIAGLTDVPIVSFFYSGGNFTKFSYPGGTQTDAHGINNSGKIVGEYVAGGAFHGFVDSGGSFATIDYPGSVLFTSAHGINDSGQIVGHFFDGAKYHGFLYSGGSFITISHPGASCPLGGSPCGTFATGINASGQIVGYFGDAAGVAHGFLYSGGSFSMIDYPGCPTGCGTFATGINASGQIVGFIILSASCGQGCLQEIVHGFLDTRGRFTAINHPNNPSFTLANGINDSGQIVGEFQGPNGPQGFVATPAPKPTVSCTANPNTLWPPDGKPVTVTVSGTITDGTSGVDPSGATYAVSDEYGQVQPSGGVTIGADGSYSFGVSLIAARDGSDKDGRTYTIVVRGKDIAGNIGSCLTVVTVPHDQGH
jgi:probable HAF family extracellular repeat protein